MVPYKTPVQFILIIEAFLPRTKMINYSQFVHGYK